MNKLNIALLAGGNSSERDIALASAKQVSDAFDHTKYNVFLIDVKDTAWLHEGVDGEIIQVDKTDFSLHTGNSKVVLDYAFIVIHGTPGEDGKLQGYLEMMGIPYSTSGFVSSVATFDKTLCKRIVSEIEGVTLAREILLRRGDVVNPEEIVAKLGLPVFIKPNASGSSCGVTKVKQIADIVPAVTNAFTEGDAVLIEEFIEGREFGCGVLMTSKEIVTFPVTEIISHKEFFDYEAKYTAGMSDEITPADIPVQLSERLQHLGASAAKACNCRGLIRADFIVTPDGRIYMIEINTVPGMSSGSIVPKQIVAAGVTMTQVIDTIIADTACRH